MRGNGPPPAFDHQHCTLEPSRLLLLPLSISISKVPYAPSIARRSVDDARRPPSAPYLEWLDSGGKVSAGSTIVLAGKKRAREGFGAPKCHVEAISSVHRMTSLYLCRASHNDHDRRPPPSASAIVDRRLLSHTHRQPTHSTNNP